MIALARRRAETIPVRRLLETGGRIVRAAIRPPPQPNPKPVLPRPAACLICGCIVFVAGLLAMGSRTLTRASYDWSFGLTHFTQHNPQDLDTIIVYVDPGSLAELRQAPNQPVDRGLYARLIRRLQADEARSVVMDVIFNEAGPRHEADEELAAAIRANGRVVVAQGISANAGRILAPVYPPFERAAAAKGLDLLEPDSDFLVRQHDHSFDDISNAPPSLSWVAAQRALTSPRTPFERNVERWVFYYGPPETVPHVSFKYALNDAPRNFFRNKTVFIGPQPAKGAFLGKRDEWPSPFPGSGAMMSTVEVHATEFLNLMRADWLTRVPIGIDILILGATGLLLSFGLLRLPPLWATAGAAGGALIFAILIQSIFVGQHLWFPWLIPVLVQTPLALTFSIVSHSLEWVARDRKLQEERRSADRRIREQAALLDKAQDAIIVHDLEWRAQYWNKSAETLYGWSFDEVIGQDLRLEVFKTDKSDLRSAFTETLAKGEWSGELIQFNRDQQELIIQSRWTLVRDEDGNPKAIFVINTNISDQKRLEAQLLRTQRVESIGTLASGIAHDLNNVLSPILIGAQLLKTKLAADERGRKVLTTMESSAQRGAGLIKQVLAFARGQEGKRGPIYLKELLRETQRIVKETFPSTIEFQHKIESTHPIFGDVTQIHQILLNLCVNARDAMPNGGRLTLTAKNRSLSEADAAKFAGAKPGEYVLLSVSDTGCGIKPEIMDRIFEPFFTTKEFGKGTGLGLSTVMTIVKTHGGFIDLQSRIGKGTTFNIYLPRAEMTDSLEDGGGPARMLWGNGETIMVVDDDPGVLELITFLLGSYGYKVITAKNGADALAVYAKNKDAIKIVLMDMMMPVMDGPTAIRELRKLQPELPVLAASGLPPGEKLKGIPGSPEVRFLLKPYAAETLLDHLKRLLYPITA